MEVNTLSITLFVLTVGVMVFLAKNTHGKIPSLAGDRSNTKPFKSWEEFYPFYLTEHSNSTCRLLHVIGTTIISLYIILFRRKYILAGILAASVGYILCEALAGMTMGFLEFAILGLVFTTSCKFLTGTNTFGLEIILCAYTFAWVGHFFFEENKPASFIYPTYSLMSDFVMMLHVYSGEIGVFDI